MVFENYRYHTGGFLVIEEMGLKPRPLGRLCVRVREVTDPPGFKILRNKASRLKVLSELRSETGEADGAM
jgi:hypothetical protein